MGQKIVAPHYEIGTNTEVAYVFSCPGRYEEKFHRPAARMTGSNLNQLIHILRAAGHHFIPLREEATLTNAWPAVEYKEKTGRSEATEKEILSPGNLDRLAAEIGHIEKLVICFGNKAILAVSELHRQNRLREGCRVAGTRHLSLLSINQIKYDCRGVPIRAGEAGNTQRRLEVLARELAQQFHTP